MRKKKIVVITDGIKYPFNKQSAGVNCNIRPFFMRMRRRQAVKNRAGFHSDKFSGADFVMATFSESVKVNKPLPRPIDRDITESPSVRITFEPIRQRETRTFKEELASISAFQLRQRIVSKRYQFNGIHGNYLNSKMIVTETPEEIREVPDTDVPEYVEVLEDPSTWIRRPTENNSVTIAELSKKFNDRRHR